jgi:hypothetical protein
MSNVGAKGRVGELTTEKATVGLAPGVKPKLGVPLKQPEGILT